MNNINTIDKKNNPKKSNGWRNLGYALMLAGLLNVNTPTYANSNNYKNITTEQVKSDSNSINGIKLPTIYQNKLDDFLANNNVMKDNDAKTFTINFIEKEMEADRGISKENQLLFIRHSIYKQVTDQDLYDGKDGNQQIAEDFNNRGVSIRIRVCGQRYKNGIIAYMSELSANAQQRSAEADRKISEADRKISEADRKISEADRKISEADSNAIESLNNALNAIIDFYNSYNISPDPKRLESFKPKVKELISRCKERNIDYKAKLPKEVRDFYDIE